MSFQLVNYIIEDRFELLRPYLDGVTTEDLTNGFITIEDILEATKSPHRLLMTVFVKKYLFPLRYLGFAMSALAKRGMKVLQDGHLDLKGKIATEELEQSSWWSPVKDIPKLPEVIANPGAVVSMDLSNNYLSNKDLKAVASLLDADLKSCRIIDLSNNRLNAGDGLEFLRQILGIEDMKVIICYNALASMEGKQFLSELSENELGKLIWIPRQWYNALGWHNAISGDKWDIAYRTHDEFYNRSQGHISIA